MVCSPSVLTFTVTVLLHEYTKKDCGNWRNVLHIAGTETIQSLIYLQQKVWQLGRWGIPK